MASMKGEALVETYIDAFKFMESPSWENVPEKIDIEQMVDDIVKNLKHIDKCEKCKSTNASENLWKDFTLYLGRNEGIGVTTLEELELVINNGMGSAPTKKVKETFGILEGIKFVQEHYKGMIQSCENVCCEPALTVVSINLLHEAMMSPVDQSKAGRFSEFDRQTQNLESGELVSYPSPEYIDQYLLCLVDDTYAMTCYFHETIRDKGISPLLVQRLMKFFAYFFHCFVSIHPYSDGNGRTARLLVCFLHNLVSSLPLPIYNWFAKTARLDYLKSLVNARVPVKDVGMFSREVRPSELATMILCCEHGVLDYYTSTSHSDSSLN